METKGSQANADWHRQLWPKVTFANNLPMKTTNHSKRIWVLLAIALAYLATRWLLIAEATTSLTLSINPGFDEDLHWRAAGLLLDGASQREPNFELMLPSSMSFTYLICLLRAISFDSIVIAKLLYSLVGLGTCFILLRIADLLRFRGGLRIMMPALYVLTPTLAYFDVMLMKSNLQLLLIAWVCHSVLRMKESRKLQGKQIALVFTALVLLSSVELSAIFIVIAALFGVLAFVDGTRPRKALVVLLFIAAPLLPMAAKAAFVSGAIYPWFLPQSGIHLAIGNATNSTGFYMQVENVPASPHGHLFGGRIVAELERGTTTSFNEANSYFTQRAITKTLDRPWESAQRFARKTAHFFNNYEAKGVDLLSHQREASVVLGLLPWCFGLTFVFALCALLCARGRERWLENSFLLLLILGPFITTQASFVTFRYRIDAWIPLLVLAAIGLRDLWNRPRSLRGNMGIVAGALLGAVFTFYPFAKERRRIELEDAKNNVTERARVQEELAETNAHRYCGTEPVRLHNSFRFTEAFRCIKRMEKQTKLRRVEEGLLIKYYLWLGDYKRIRVYLDTSEYGYRDRPNYFSDIEFEALRRLL